MVMAQIQPSLCETQSIEPFPALAESGSTPQVSIPVRGPAALRTRVDSPPACTSSDYHDVHAGANQRVWSSFRAACADTYPKYVSLLPLDCPAKDWLERFVAEARPGASSEECGLRSSAFLFRKVLSVPVDKDKALLRYLKALGTGDNEVSNDSEQEREAYRKVIQSVVHDYFPLAWDETVGYVAIAGAARASKGACYEGGKAREKVEEVMTWEEFLRRAVDGQIDSIPKERKVVVLVEGGKTRTVTIASLLQQQLMPLHIALQRCLYRSKVFLRGTPTPEVLGELGREAGSAGDVYTSGDYEAATDGMVCWRQLMLLDEIRRQSTVVPSEVWEAAKSRLQGGKFVFRTEKGEEGESPRMTGQLMGDLLSFPLLCAGNLVAFRGAVGIDDAREIEEKYLVRINGDDIVFRSSVEISERWMEGVGKLGFKLSRGKTLVHKRFFSVNSCFFIGSSRKQRDGSLGPEKRRGHVTRVPIIRAKTLFNKEPTALWSCAISLKASLGERAARLVVMRFLRSRTRLLATGVPGFSDPEGATLLCQMPRGKWRTVFKEVYKNPLFVTRREPTAPAEKREDERASVLGGRKCLTVLEPSVVNRCERRLRQRVDEGVSITSARERWGEEQQPTRLSSLIWREWKPTALQNLLLTMAGLGDLKNQPERAGQVIGSNLGQVPMIRYPLNYECKERVMDGDAANLLGVASLEEARRGGVHPHFVSSGDGGKLRRPYRTDWSKALNVSPSTTQFRWSRVENEDGRKTIGLVCEKWREE